MRGCSRGCAAASSSGVGQVLAQRIPVQLTLVAQGWFVTSACWTCTTAQHITHSASQLQSLFDHSRCNQVCLLLSLLVPRVNCHCSCHGCFLWHALQRHCLCAPPLLLSAPPHRPPRLGRSQPTRSRMAMQWSTTRSWLSWLPSLGVTSLARANGLELLGKLWAAGGSAGTWIVLVLTW
jgi:hypothetical protein